MTDGKGSTCVRSLSMVPSRRPGFASSIGILRVNGRMSVEAEQDGMSYEDAAKRC
jgi:hypothetical protein